MQGIGRKNVVEAVEAVFENSEDTTVVLAIKVLKCRTKLGGVVRRARTTSQSRVLAITTTKRPGTTQRLNVKISDLEQVSGAGSSSSSLQISKEYKLKYLLRVEAMEGDTSGLGFVFVFGNTNLKSSGSPPTQWICQTLDDRNWLFVCLRQLSKDQLGFVPGLVGFDLVELALWAQSYAKPLPNSGGGEKVFTSSKTRTEVLATGLLEPLSDQHDLVGGSLEVVGQHDLVSAEEEKDMEALLGTYVMGIDEAEAFSERLKRELSALEAANVHAILESELLVQEVVMGLDDATNCAEDMDEWLHIFNTKLKHMKDDIEMIEARNNMLEMQEHNNRGLFEELDKLLNGLRVPPEYASLLMESPFDEPLMPTNIEACEWLVTALTQLSAFNKAPIYAEMRAVREKREELETLKSRFVRRAREFLQDYFTTVVEFMPEKQYTVISQKGRLRRPDHKELLWKFKTYASVIVYLKSLDESALPPVRKAYASAMNHLLRRETRDFASELKTAAKVPRIATSWLELGGGTASLPTPGGNGDTSAVSDAFGRMLHIFIPLYFDESQFFAAFMCFDASPAKPVSRAALNGGNTTASASSGANASTVVVAGRGDEIKDDDEDDVTPMVSLDCSDLKTPAPSDKDVRELNSGLELLLGGVHEEFTLMVDWAYKIDPLRCITMLGITDRWLLTHGSETGSFMQRMLRLLQERMQQNLDKFVEDTIHSIEKYERNVRIVGGILSFIPRFAALAQRMESFVKDRSRDAVDRAYNRIVSAMFQTLENIAKVDPKHADVVLLENYAVFQNSMYDIAQVVPTLAEYYTQASNLYEAACKRYIASIIDYQFGRLFEFSKKLEESLRYNQRTPEEIAFHTNLTRADLRKLIKATLATPGVEKLLQTMWKRMQKHLSPELLPSLWEKGKEVFLAQYETFENLILKCYPGEVLSPSSNEMRELFKPV